MAVLLSVAGTTAADATPRVAASIKPVHSLVAGVMDGIGTPTLLVKGGASPHSYAMKPSEARAIRNADLIFWIGPALESFLPKTLAARNRKNGAVELSHAAGVGLIAHRHGRGAKGHHDHGHGHGAHNMHLWLDPANAKAMTAAIVQALVKIDHGNSARYRANAKEMRDRLDGLDAELRRNLAGVLKTPYVVFHDAYPYFERRYGLNNVGTITVSPEAKPGAKRVHAIRRTLLLAGAACVFGEPQFEPALVKAVVRGTPTRIGVLDPLGAEIEPGKEAYFTLMRELGASFRRCLRRSG